MRMGNPAVVSPLFFNSPNETLVRVFCNSRLSRLTVKLADEIAHVAIMVTGNKVLYNRSLMQVQQTRNGVIVLNHMQRHVLAFSYHAIVVNVWSTAIRYSSDTLFQPKRQRQITAV